MSSLTKEQVDALYAFITEFRYEYEGPRDTDSIEQFMDDYVKSRSQ